MKLIKMGLNEKRRVLVDPPLGMCVFLYLCFMALRFFSSLRSECS